MSFDWSEYLNVAERLLDAEGDSQARFRASLSRAYYALMHVAAARLPGFRVGQEKIHSQLLREYQRRHYDEDVYIYIRLRNLKEEREKADYMPEVEFKEANVRRRVQDARDAINKAKRGR